MPKGNRKPKVKPSTEQEVTPQPIPQDVNVVVEAANMAYQMVNQQMQYDKAAEKQAKKDADTTWFGKDGRTKIKDMETSHIANALATMTKNVKELVDAQVIPEINVDIIERIHPKAGPLRRELVRRMNGITEGPEVGSADSRESLEYYR